MEYVYVMIKSYERAIAYCKLYIGGKLEHNDDNW